MRTRKAEERNFVNGYDDAKFVKTEGSIKAQLSFEGPSRPLQLQPPAKGNHRLAKVQTIYEDVSRFLSDQTWRTPKEETRAIGTIWLELFILFDTLGYRRREGLTRSMQGRRGDRMKGRPRTSIRGKGEEMWKHRSTGLALLKNWRLSKRW